ncbi:FtsX-like permease family protein [Agromyces sp. SYSU T00194]|uniref:FtsX-like permease family protein n=1 Tax=Agromyces chitinivorans TaxID=3158560 RepID=UPI003397AC75
MTGPSTQGRGNARFLLARARAALPVLVALAVTTAVAAATLAGLVGAIAVVESRAALAAVAAAPGDGDRVVVRPETGEPANAVPAVRDALGALGAPGGLAIEVDGRTIVLTPDPVRFTADAAAALAAGLGDLDDAVADAGGPQVQVSGGLRRTLLELLPGLESRRGPTAVAVGITGLVAAVAVAAVALEVVRVRTTETRLQRARGASRRRLIGIAASEATVVATLGALAGAVGGTVVAAVAGGVVIGVWPAVAAAAAVVLVAVAAVVIGTFRGADRTSARADGTALIGAAVLVAIVTGVAVWQFVQAGSAVVVRGDGSRGVDPIVAIAPALVLALAGLVAVAVAAPVARAVAAAFAGGRGASPVTPLRLASRRPARHAVTIAVVVLAAGAVTLAVAYRGSIEALGQAPEDVRVGADVRVELPDGVAAGDVADVAGADAAMAVRPLEVRGSDGTIPVLPVQAAQLGDVLADADGTIDPQALAEALGQGGDGPAGVALPDGTRSFTVELHVPEGEYQQSDGTTFPGPPPAMTAGFILADAEGRFAQLAATNVEIVELGADDDGNQLVSFERLMDSTTELELPAGGPWTIVELRVGHAEEYGIGAPAGAPVDLVVRADGQPVDLTALELAPGGDGSIQAYGDGIRVGVPSPSGPSTEAVRAVPAGAPTRVPAVFTEQVAAAMGAETGDELSLRIPTMNATIDFEVVDVIPLLPGAPDGQGILTDLVTASLSAAVPLEPTEVWFGTTDAAEVALAVEEAFPAASVDAADPLAAADAERTAIAFVLAAAAATVLALVVLVLRRTRTRQDTRELAVLAVLGLGRRGAARVRTLEEVSTLVLGAVGGVAAGLATAWVVVPALVRGAYVDLPDTFPVVLDLDPLVLAAAVGALLAASILIAATVRAPAALAPVLREDE